MCVRNKMFHVSCAWFKSLVPSNRDQGHIIGRLSAFFLSSNWSWFQREKEFEQFSFPSWSPNNMLSGIHITYMHSRWVSVVEFHDGALGIGKVFGQESTAVKWNYQILSLHLVTVCQKVPILDFQSEFSMSKIIRIFLKKIHWRISI